MSERARVKLTFRPVGYYRPERINWHMSVKGWISAVGVPGLAALVYYAATGDSHTAAEWGLSLLAALFAPQPHKM